MVPIFLVLLFSFSPGLCLLLHEKTSLNDLSLDPPATQPLADGLLNTNEFIFGGKKAEAGFIPMQAAIIYKKTGKDKSNYLCGGTLISPNHVLTAAHCTVKMTFPAKIMVGGVHLRKNTTNTQWRHIHTIHTHPLYNDSDVNTFHDIGIVEFRPAVHLNWFTKVANLVKNDNEFLTGNGLASGYGEFEYIGRHSAGPSMELRYADLTIYPFGHCVKARPLRRFSYGQFCAGAAGTGMGRGDSGGPIQAVRPGKLIQLGIASYGTSSFEQYEHQDKWPVVYTRISQYCDYIRKTTGGAAECQ